VKPARFAYYDPASVGEVLDLLAQHGDAAKVLAGGQSLVPLMNMRLARPENVVDLNGVPELSYLEEQDGGLRIGAMTRQRQLEKSALVAERWPLLAEATRYIGHSQIRNRGTVGGSLAHADPAAELPAVTAALEAQLVIRGPSGERVVGADDFFLTYLTTCLAPDELLVEIRLPAPPPGSRPAFQEVSRRHGDFALAGAAGLVALDEQGVCRDARIALFGVGPGPYRAREAEDLLKGEKPTEALLQQVGLKAAENLEPDADIHASAEYRKEVAAVMVRRALLAACGITPTPVPVPGYGRQPATKSGRSPSSRRAGRKGRKS
jgi:aerobic carbon-monoxide dehydrogenase medium subunit